MLTHPISGLLVYDVSAQSGFGEHGRVGFTPSEAATCWNWWTDASSQVRRRVFVDDYVLSVSGSQVKVNHLDDLATDLAVVSIVYGDE